MRGIDTKDYASIQRPSSFGKPAKLEWLSIQQLVIDPEYQREITPQGRSNVRRIAGAFSWSMFAPVIVASVGSNKFAIIDGQHRTTAAALCGIEKVPCAIIEAKRGEQAAAFKAINGNITRLSSIQIHHAAVAAGDASAQRIDKVCKTAGVVVLRYPKPHNTIASGETMAVGALRRVLDTFGDEPVVAALGAINSAGGGYPGNLRAPIIRAVTELLSEHKDWRGARLKAAFEEIYPDEMLVESMTKAARQRGTSATAILKADLERIISSRIRARGKAA